MRPPANIIRQWMKEKNSFPVRGLVMLHVPGTGWLCNIEILRARAKEIEDMPPEKAAFEIALSAIFRYITSTVYTGESIPVVTTRGTELLVPTIAFDMAPFLVDKVKKILAEGGGGINVNQVAIAQKFLARATTGSAKGAEAYGLPKVVSGAQRIKHRLEYEARLTAQQIKSMARRRKLLARHWLKQSGGSFYYRGLVFSFDSHGFWAFNINSGHDQVDHNSEDQQALENLAFAVSVEAVQKYTRAVNFERDGETRLKRDESEFDGQVRVPAEVIETASHRVAKRLLSLMKKHQHGVLSHKVIERALVIAWDPQDEKPLDEYPFPLAPTSDFEAIDRQALDRISELFSRKRARRLLRDEQPQAPITVDTDSEAQPKLATSWREELEIDDWVPLDEPVEDDETLDRKALEKADHDQSAALRRIRGSAGGRIMPDDTSSPVHHKVDYAGLPKDED